MIEPQLTPNETYETRAARIDRAIAHWRSRGFVYVTLAPNGVARPQPAGQLAQLIAAVSRHAGAQLIELAAPSARDTILRWAILPRPITKQESTN